MAPDAAPVSVMRSIRASISRHNGQYTSKRFFAIVISILIYVVGKTNIFGRMDE